MRKNSIFTILAVVLSLTGANADEITNLTLDTPVNWSVAAFNRSIALYCGTAEDVVVARREILPSSTELGSYGRKELYSYKDITVTVMDLEKYCAQFVLQYGMLYRQTPQISLQNVLNICMKTINNSGRCAHIAQSLVYYSMGQNAIDSVETEINSSMNTAENKIFSSDKRFYIKGQLQYTNNGSNRNAPRLTDGNLYETKTNTMVGICDFDDESYGKYDYDSLQCGFVVRDYASLDCFVSFGDSEIYCVDRYIEYQEDVIKNMGYAFENAKRQYEWRDAESKWLTPGSKDFDYNECAKSVALAEMSNVERDKSLFGPVLKTYSYSRWKETKDFHEGMYNGVIYIFDLVRDRCGPDPQAYHP